MRQGQRSAPTQSDFLTQAKLKATEQEYRCFDHETGTYEVVEPGGTNDAGELTEGLKHKVVITQFTCTCMRPQRFHFPCSHMVTAC
jgi:hypothetical protein